MGRLTGRAATPRPAGRGARGARDAAGGCGAAGSTARRGVRTRARRGLTAAVAVLLLTAPGAPAGFRAQLDRAGLADVRAHAPGVQVELRYATADNFTGRRLPGYCVQEPFLRERAARALGRAERRLRGDGLGLRVLDAYRPARASRAMVRWARGPAARTS